MDSGFIDGEGNIAGRFADITLLSPSRNGYMELYKAKRYGQWFVLKRLTSDATADPGCKNLLQKEFLIGSSLDHPHIGKTISMERVEGLGECVVEEYIDGMDWDRFFGEKRPSRKETLRIMDELCAALSYLHSKQLVHRDLKPSNVLITHNGHHVKLIDFGLADSDSLDLLKKEGWPGDATQAARYDIVYAQHLNMIRSHLPECQKRIDAMSFGERYLLKAKWFSGLKADESVTVKSQDEQLKFLKGLFE